MSESIKVLWYSSSPSVKSGYGTQTRGILNQLTKYYDINIDIYSYYGHTNNGKTIKINNKNVNIYAGNGKLFDKNILDYSKNYDITVTHMDQWLIAGKLKDLNTDMIHWCIIDQTPPPTTLKHLSYSENTKGIVPMSYWAKDLMEEYYNARNIYEPIYHGVDLDTFNPDVYEYNPRYEQLINDTDFLVGLISTNSFRELIPQNMEAFCMFAEKIDEKARLYINADYNKKSGYNLITVMQHLKSEYDIDDDQIIFKNPNKDKLTDRELATLYANMDVNLGTSMGDSFGIPIIEAGACSTPSIVTDFSAPPELINGERGISVDVAEYFWLQRSSSKQAIPKTEEISDTLMYYYENPKRKNKHGGNMKKWVKKECSWDKIGNKWVDLLYREIE